jgi:hypothetical protein
MSAEARPLPVPGGDKDTPIFMKMVRADDGEIRWGRILVMLGLTILSGYLATASQRARAQPDMLRTARMRALRASRRACQAQADFWQVLATRSAQEYQKARL